jgi:hypothetical protein
MTFFFRNKKRVKIFCCLGWTTIIWCACAYTETETRIKYTGLHNMCEECVITLDAVVCGVDISLYVVIGARWTTCQDLQVILVLWNWFIFAYLFATSCTRIVNTLMRKRMSWWWYRVGGHLFFYYDRRPLWIRRDDKEGRKAFSGNFKYFLKEKVIFTTIAPYDQKKCM